MLGRLIRHCLKQIERQVEEFGYADIHELLNRFKVAKKKRKRNKRKNKRKADSSDIEFEEQLAQFKERLASDE